MSSDNQSYSDRSNAAAAITNQLMIAALVFLVMAVIFAFFLYIYAKHYMGPRNRHRNRRNTVLFVFSPALPRRGLDADILASLQTRPFKNADFDGGLECSVCLSEVSEGEEVRILPKCGHGFHVGCIDMWFHSNTTCPLCRVAVESPAGSAADARTSRAGGMLVVDVPARAVEGFSSSQTPTTTSGRLSSKSFGRLLSRGKAGVGSSCSPRGGDDIEHGGGGEGSSRSPKTPTR